MAPSGYYKARLSDVPPHATGTGVGIDIVTAGRASYLLGDRRYELGPTIWSGFSPRRTPTDRPFV